MEDMEDSRPRPKYEILFKQDVMSEDVFLGMGEKTPGSSDCTHMTIRIQFPGHTMKVRTDGPARVLNATPTH